MSAIVRGGENVCNPAVKYRFSKKLGCWVRTWFTIEENKDDKSQYFQQHNAFSKDRNTDWAKWLNRPVGSN